MSLSGSATAPEASIRTTRVLSIPASDGAPTHLVVLLHGLGADATDVHAVGTALASALPRADVLIPDGFQPFDGGGNGRQWLSIQGVTDANRPARVREAAGGVSRWIDAELEKRRLSGNRLVVAGFSQGAMVTGWLSIHRTPRPVAGILLSGRVAEEESPSVGISGPRVFVAHGDRDPVIPVFNAAPAARTLEAWGGLVTMRIYPGMGHEITAQELRDAAEFVRSAVVDTDP
jgi:phospholipase/carboxylesterase